MLFRSAEKSPASEKGSIYGHHSTRLKPQAGDRERVRESRREREMQSERPEKMDVDN